jgi:AcrR family transcriptional regulator
VNRVNQRDDQRADTRLRLLEAAADVFAAKGIAGASVNDIAKAADRTTGAIYDHFGSKQNLVFALVDEWADDNARATLEALAQAEQVDDVLLALWKGARHSASGDGQWLRLEIELWTYGQRDAEVQERLRERFHQNWAGIEALADRWPELAPVRGRGPVFLGVLTGLEMMRRVDASAVPDGTAVGVLRSLLVPDLDHQGDK